MVVTMPLPERQTMVMPLPVRKACHYWKLQKRTKQSLLQCNDCIYTSDRSDSIYSCDSIDSIDIKICRKSFKLETFVTVLNKGTVVTVVIK